MVISFSAVRFMTLWQGAGGEERNLLFMLSVWFSNACRFFSYVWFPLESLMTQLFTAGYLPCQISPSKLWLKNAIYERWDKETFSYTKRIFTLFFCFFLFPKREKTFSRPHLQKAKEDYQNGNCSAALTLEVTVLCFSSTKEAKKPIGRAPWQFMLTRNLHHCECSLSCHCF